MNKRRIVWMTTLLLVCVCLGAQAGGSKLEYTLSIKNNTVLQSEADRGIAVQYPAVRDAIPGESPVTGLPWEGEYLPMLVQIGNDKGTAQVNGYRVDSAGIGKRTPWGIQYADIIYEELVYRTGYTRFAVLFSDSLAQGEPAAGTGPVRSCRIGPLMLCAEWQCGLLHGGDFVGETWDWLLEQTKAVEKGLLLDAYSTPGTQGNAVKGIKMPNYNTYVVQNRDLIPASYVSTPHPFLFQNGGTYADGYAAADTVNLDWGDKNAISHFVYNAQDNAYSRYCGAGIKPKKWVQFEVFPTPEKRGDNDRVPMTFANIIVQRVEYTFENDNKLRPVVHAVGQGNADIFLDGKYIAGYWVRPSLGEPTVFYDDRGNELQFNRGKTFIAQFPVEARCTFTAGE